MFHKRLWKAWATALAAMAGRICYLNGRWVPEPEARLSIYDTGLLYGQMVYEVTRTVRQVPFRLEEHLARLWQSLASMRIALPPDLTPETLARHTLACLERNLPTEADDVDWNIFHQISPGPAAEFTGEWEPAALQPTLSISCYPLLNRLAALAKYYEQGIDLVVPAQRAIPPELIDPAIKHRGRWYYRLAALQAQQQLPGAWAALVDPQGYLTESASANLFVVRAGELLTPPVAKVLPGVTRTLVWELAERLGIRVHEADLTERDASMAEEIFATSTSIGILHARRFAGTTLGNGQAGEMTLRLRQALEAEIGLDFAAQACSYAKRLAR